MPDPIASDDLARLLAASGLAEAQEALAAIQEGWAVERHGPTASCQELLQTYEIRHRHIMRSSTAHARRLAASVAEFVNRLRQHASERAFVYSIQGKAEHHFVVFRLDGRNDVLGCMRVVSQLGVSPERWMEYWDVPA
jgi:hypothetical protein